MNHKASIGQGSEVHSGKDHLCLVCVCFECVLYTCVLSLVCGEGWEKWPPVTSSAARTNTEIQRTPHEYSHTHTHTHTAVLICFEAPSRWLHGYKVPRPIASLSIIIIHGLSSKSMTSLKHLALILTHNLTYTRTLIYTIICLYSVDGMFLCINEPQWNQWKCIIFLYTVCILHNGIDWKLLAITATLLYISIVKYQLLISYVRKPWGYKKNFVYITNLTIYFFIFTLFWIFALWAPMCLWRFMNWTPFPT